MLVIIALAAFAFATSSAAAATPPNAYGPGHGRLVTGKPKCGTIAALTGEGTAPSQAEVLKAKGMSCAKARRIVASCISHDRIKGWRASPLNITATLSRNKQRISYSLVSGPPPRCARGLQRARKTGEFGPYQQPIASPSNWPAPYTIHYDWTSPVTTFSATIGDNSITDVTVSGAAHNRDGKMRSFWFEYGKTRDLGNETEKQNPKTTSDDAPLWFNAKLLHLRAATRYYWRAVARIDEAGGKIETVYGALGSFVTKGYPKIKDPSRPCESVPDIGQLFQVTESLAISCSQRYTMTEDGCFPFCVGFYSGRLACDKAYPRNLNSGTWSVTIPKVDYRLDVNNLVSYWRSNDSNRFITTPLTNKNSAGGEVGPVPGWHEWDVGQYAYPFTSTRTDAQFWINCTDQWGNVIDASALAQGEGDDKPSTTPPGTPTGFAATKTADGGLRATWNEPSSTSPSGIAGYYLTVVAWAPGTPKVFGDSWSTPVDFTDTNGTISAAYISVVKKSIPTGWSPSVAVGAVSREGSVGVPAVIPLDQLGLGRHK